VKILFASVAGLLLGLLFMGVLTQVQEAPRPPKDRPVPLESAAMKDATLRGGTPAASSHTLRGVFNLAGEDPRIVLRISSPILIGLGASLTGLIILRRRNRS